MSKRKASDTPATFESRLARLEEIVAKLEAGDVGLDESLALYAEGAGILKECRATLGEAEKKIARLTETASGDVETEPFEPEDDGEA
jgi:exodeoxyribonuclease VII small subunit